jgi:acyl carrier protein
MSEPTLKENATEQRVRKVIATTFRLSPEDAQGELRMGNPASWDSLGHMELVLAIEAEFGVTFSNFVIADLMNVPAIVHAIEEKGST